MAAVDGGVLYPDVPGEIVSHNTYGPVLMKCAVCGEEEYRTPKWTPNPTPQYAGDEIMLPEWCRIGTAERCPTGNPGCLHMAECVGQLHVVHGGRVDLLPEDFTVDVGNGPQRFSSLSEVRKFEAESERKFRNGDGQPYVFRSLSQEPGNNRTNVFSGSNYETGRSAAPPKRTTGRGGRLPIQIRNTDR